MRWGARRKQAAKLQIPQAIRYTVPGIPSQRINKEHRLVYRVAAGSGKDQTLQVAGYQYHR
ncbi:type II toxin-antitoxin system YoeB family toxin [Sphingomonas sp. FW199]|uniref:type II toxin-antitoxin system YoeB family toxin n=1 Tax=Sphingomonas sp. FW199 TaxID=3400217 RepID=UPI003CF0AB22